jgi:hypothetical protein
MSKYRIVKEGGGYTVWSMDQETAISNHRTQREAERAVKMCKAMDRGRGRT